MKPRERSTSVQVINELFQDMGDGYKLKSMSETTGARSRKDSLDRPMTTGIFDNRISTTECGFSTADRARTLKKLGVA